MTSTLSLVDDRTTQTNHLRYTPGSLVRQLSTAFDENHGEEQIAAVRQVLVNAITEHPGFLPESFQVPNADHYARRPLYIDPEGRFSIVVMTWSKGQGTMLHDHGGAWVVECVYRGQMKVTDYDYLGEARGLHQFRPAGAVFAGPGESGYRMPPEEHHTLENMQDEPSITIHVFGGRFEECGMFEPADGGYVRRVQRMKFTID